ncbi:MAG: hypothetical protein IT267_06290 [Saprospiraceae bacterium]|nr:hypothetical protein [Saprospiraceae bacterium]
MKEIKTDQVIDLLYKEYEIAGDRIEDYQRSHFRYYSGILLFLIAIFTYFHGQGSKNISLEFLPYPLLFISILIYYHYHRTLVIQAFRRIIGQEVNKIMDQNILIFHLISDKYIISPKRNISIGIFSLLNVLFFAFIIYYCSKDSQSNLNSYLQYIILFFQISLYIYSTYFIQQKVERDMVKIFNTQFLQKP